MRVGSFPATLAQQEQQQDQQQDQKDQQQGPPPAQPPTIPVQEPAPEPQEAKEAPSSPATEPPLEVPSDQPFLIHGSLRMRYRYRATPDAHDSDLENLLTLDAGDARVHPVTGHLSLWTNSDLDGSSGGNGADPFFGLSDTYDDDLTAHLYQAYVDAPGVSELEVLRLGRQPLEDAPEFVTFDGVRVETREQGPKAWRAGAYGGIPTHHFESSSQGDLMYGTFFEARPWNTTRARVDWLHLEDEQLLEKHRNDLLSARIWHSEGHLRVNAGYSWLESASRDASGSVNWYDPDSDLHVQATYYQLLETQKSLATEVDPFFDAMFEQFPFVRASVLATKGFGERYRVELGTEFRRLVDGSDEGEFNREYERTHAQLEIDRLAGQPLTLALTGELWDSDTGGLTSWSADLTREWEERWRTSIGSYFALYDMDLFTLDERQDVRVYSLTVRYDTLQKTLLELGYEFENDELDQYQALRVGVTWHF